MSTTSENATMKKKRKINSKRIDISDLKAGEKLGVETIAVIPKKASEIEIMFSGKLALICLEGDTRANNAFKAFLKVYKDQVTPDIRQNLEEQIKFFQKGFLNTKKLSMHIAEQHELWNLFKGVRGFSAYQLALLIAMIKDIGRFETASKLMVYSGIGSINGLPVTKANLAKIKEYYFKEKGREFKGFNTKLSGRMFVIVDCLLRGEGWFYKEYRNMSKRLIQRCINNNEIDIITPDGEKQEPVPLENNADLDVDVTDADFEETAQETVKGSASNFQYDPDKHAYIIETLRKKGFVGEEQTVGTKKKIVFKKVRILMKNKKNQSLKMFVEKNVKRRLARILLHLLWHEWRELKGLPTRVPYPIEYLGHGGLITLKEVVDYDALHEERKN